MQNKKTNAVLIQQQVAAIMMSYTNAVSHPVASPHRAAKRYARITARPALCGGVLIDAVPSLQAQMRLRRSWFKRRRRAAYRACLQIIQFREAALGIGAWGLEGTT